MNDYLRNNEKIREEMKSILQNENKKLFKRYKLYNKVSYNRIFDRGSRKNQKIMKDLKFITGATIATTFVSTAVNMVSSGILRTGANLSVSSANSIRDLTNMFNKIADPIKYLAIPGVVITLGVYTLSIAHTFLNDLKENFNYMNKERIDEEILTINYLEDYDSGKNDKGLFATKLFLDSIALEGNSFGVNQKLFSILAKIRKSCIDYSNKDIDFYLFSEINKRLINEIKELRLNKGASKSFKYSSRLDDEFLTYILNNMNNNTNKNQYVQTPEYQTRKGM